MTHSSGWGLIMKGMQMNTHISSVIYLNVSLFVPFDQWNYCSSSLHASRPPRKTSYYISPRRTSLTKRCHVTAITSRNQTILFPLARHSVHTSLNLRLFRSITATRCLISADEPRRFHGIVSTDVADPFGPFAFYDVSLHRAHFLSNIDKEKRERKERCQRGGWPRFMYKSRKSGTRESRC